MSIICLSETTGFTLRFQKSKNITLTDGALDVTHNQAVLVIKELYTNLSDLTTATSAANDLHDDCQFDRGVLKEWWCR